MSTVMQERNYNNSGDFRREGFNQLLGPYTVREAGADILPANDTKANSTSLMRGQPSTTPFDNGSTEYRYIVYSADILTGLRVAYDDDGEGAYSNEVIVTGFAGGVDANYPCFTLDLAGYADAKEATKMLWYLDTGEANTDIAQLRYLTIDNDNNKTGTGDAAVTSTDVIGATAEWNAQLHKICYAKHDEGAPNTGAPYQWKYFILGIFSDGTNSYIGAIYGSSIATLKSVRLSVSTDHDSNSTIGPDYVVPLTGNLGQAVSLPGIGLLLLISNAPTTLGTATSISLARSTDAFWSLHEMGDSFLGLDANNVGADLRAVAFEYNASAELDKYIMYIEGDTGVSIQKSFFSGFGVDASSRGQATYI